MKNKLSVSGAEGCDGWE